MKHYNGLSKLLIGGLLILPLAGCANIESPSESAKISSAQKEINASSSSQPAQTIKAQAYVQTFKSQQACQDYLNSVKNLNHFTVSVSTSNYVTHITDYSGNGGMTGFKLKPLYTVTLLPKTNQK